MYTRPIIRLKCRPTQFLCIKLALEFEASARSGCSLIVHSVCIDFSYRWLAVLSRHLITCTAHLSIELWKMQCINDNK